MMTQELQQTQTILTVAELNRSAKMLLETHFKQVWVEGEISNFTAPHSGHWYFSLKDNDAQVRSAMFKGHQRKLDFQPKDGSHVLVKAKVSLYEGRGDYQLIVEFMEERGEGKLKRAFELLKKKLEAEGLFRAEHKKPLPRLPKQIGVITSATGAAIRDILNVLKRRFRVASVCIYPCLVQGTQAAPQIVKAIELANQRQECEVLILARGGGSLEDLWPFNEEIVARAIHASELPIISGIGHEIDFTIADFVADQRAPTPSAAAELSVPDASELEQTLQKLKQNIQKTMRDRLERFAQTIDWLDKRLEHSHPQKRLREQSLQLTHMQARLAHTLKNQIAKLLHTLQQNQVMLVKHSPTTMIHAEQKILQNHSKVLQSLTLALLHQRELTLAKLASTLHTLSPLATLGRGYAIASNQNGDIINSVQKIAVHDKLLVRFSDGEAHCTVSDINNN